MSDTLVVWMLTLNYSPEPSGFAPHAKALAEHLTTQGHQVTVITGFPFAPQWKRWPQYRGVVTRVTVQPNGLTRHRVSHFIPRNPGSMWQRVVMELSFCVAAGLAAVAARVRGGARPGAVLYVGAQPAIAMLARLVAWCSGAPYFVGINDLASRAAADVGIVRSGVMYTLLQRFEFAAYLPAAGATVLCQSFADALTARGYPLEHVRLIMSPVDLAQVRPLPFRSRYRRRLALPANAFVVLFAGSMGLKQGLANVVEAARRLHACEANGARTVWVLVGDGQTRAEILRLVARHHLESVVRLLPFQPAEDLAEMFAVADVLLLNQIAAVTKAVLPSKLLTYMAAGKPVLAAVHAASQGADLLRCTSGGLLVAPDDPAALVGGVEALICSGAKERAAMGRRNRLYAERCFDQRRVLDAHASFVIGRVEQLRATQRRPRALAS